MQSGVAPLYNELLLYKLLSYMINYIMNFYYTIHHMQMGLLKLREDGIPSSIWPPPYLTIFNVHDPL